MGWKLNLVILDLSAQLSVLRQLKNVFVSYLFWLLIAKTRTYLIRLKNVRVFYHNIKHLYFKFSANAIISGSGDRSCLTCQDWVHDKQSKVRVITPSWRLLITPFHGHVLLTSEVEWWCIFVLTIWSQRFQLIFFINLNTLRTVFRIINSTKGKIWRLYKPTLYNIESIKLSYFGHRKTTT